MNYYMSWDLNFTKQVKILSVRICFVVGGKAWDSCIYKQIYTINKKYFNSIETNKGKKTYNKQWSRIHQQNQK